MMQSHWAARKNFYLAFALCGAALAGAWLLAAIFQSKSSTAPVGLILLPGFAGAGAAAGAIFAFVALTARDLFTREKVGTGRLLAAVGILLLSALSGAGWVYDSRALAEARNPQTSPAELEQIFGKSFFLRQRAVSEALAANPATPLGVLERMVRGGPAELASLVGANPGVSEALLEEIVRGPRSFDRLAGAASNPKLSRAAMEYLVAVGPANFPGSVEYRLYQTYVLAALARRPDIPREIFDRLANWENPEYFLVVAVISAPQVSCAQLGRFSGQGSAVLNGMVEREQKKRHCE